MLGWLGAGAFDTIELNPFWLYLGLPCYNELYRIHTSFSYPVNALIFFLIKYTIYRFVFFYFSPFSISRISHFQLNEHEIIRKNFVIAARIPVTTTTTINSTRFPSIVNFEMCLNCLGFVWWVWWRSAYACELEESCLHFVSVCLPVCGHAKSEQSKLISFEIWKKSRKRSYNGSGRGSEFHMQ